MFQEYLDFQIQISALDEVRYRLSASGPGGDASGVLTFSSLESAYQAIQPRLNRLDADEDMLTVFGHHLFDALFQDAIKEVYIRTQACLGPGQGLRVRLHIAPTDLRLAALPWEYLYDPDQGPLALLDTSIVRYLPQHSRIPPLATPLPLKVLLASAQTPPILDVERELREIQAALSELGNHLQVTVEPHLTITRFQHLLRQGFHVWHFVGHGAPSADGRTGRLLFEDMTGDSEGVSAMQLALMLHRSGLRVVMLNACHSAMLTLDPFRSVGPALMRAQVAAVIAMQFTVHTDAARVFAVEFYSVLAAGYPIDACVTEGRKAVMNASGLGQPDWGIPVLYTRAQDGMVFETIAPPLPTSDITNARRTIGEGMAALYALVQLPQVRAALTDCRDDLHAASKRLRVLTAYKELHDQFQQLDNCYSCINRTGKHLLADELAWTYIANNVRELQQIVDGLLDCAGHPVIGESEAFWTRRLDRARKDLELAVKQRDVLRMTQAIQLVGDVLAREPSRINTRLLGAAAELRLADLLHTLHTGHARLLELQMADEHVAHQVDVFQGSIDTFAELADTLEFLISAHNAFQEIDDELRLVEAWLEQDVSELSKAWQHLRPKMEKLCRGNQTNWATKLTAICADLEQVLSAEQGNPMAIRETFLDYHSQVNRSFNKIDWDLRNLCGKLQDVGNELAPILGTAL
jgi:CHAT domain